MKSVAFSIFPFAVDQQFDCTINKLKNEVIKVVKIIDFERILQFSHALFYFLILARHHDQTKKRILIDFC